MQLKRKAGKRSSLAAATFGLLGAAVAPAPAAAQTESPPERTTRPWEFDTGMLVYAEGDSRVMAIEPVVLASHDFGDERIVTLKVVFDSLSGASPNGATPASTPQTFTRPSGAGSYTVEAGELPLDGTFKDSRWALSGDYVFPVSDSGKFGYGLAGSTEFDFRSFGGNLRYALDFNQHNTTLSAGLSYEADTISAVGGEPTPLAVVPPPGGPGNEGGGESKGVVDVVIGLSQVLDPLSVAQFNYSLSASSGYHTDPYKILSVVDANGEPLRYVYESRPDARTKHALFARYKRFVFARDVFDVSYRYMTDDWKVRSSTVDTLYRWNFADNKYFEPHLRWYAQTAADFYRVALYDGEETTVDFASADPRLGAFTGWTAGLKYGQALASGNQWSARLEYYRQAGKVAGVPDPAAAGLAKFDLEPDLTAAMVTFGYRFQW